MNLTITTASYEDVGDIVRVLRANRGDHSLFQQSPSRVRRVIDEFTLARSGSRTLGCIAVHAHPGGSVEILSVAVMPEAQGLGVGSAMVAAAIRRARAHLASRHDPVPLIWLGTAKPGYFARHGFSPMSRWRLPLGLLIRKLRSVFQQPISRWLPAIFGRHVFMAL